MAVADMFTDEDRRRINATVAAAEGKTAAEIVPVVAGSSGRYDRAEDICGLWLGLMLLAAVWILLPSPVRAPGDWGGLDLLWYPVALIAAVVVGFVGGAVLADKVPPLRRIFTPEAQMRDEVWTRARQTFFDHRVHHTSGSSGVLLYVSLYEHRAAIVADQPIIERLGQARIDELCAHFTARLKTDSLIDAYCQTIDELGALLEPLFPAPANRANELPDALVTLESL